MIALLVAGAVSLGVSLVGTPFLISWLRARGVGQHIQEELTGHAAKAGTPTMGGLMIVAAAALGYVLAHLREETVFTRGGLLVMLAILGAAGVGLVDDWISITRARNLGLSKGGKYLGLLAVGLVFTVLAVRWANVNTNLSFTRFDSIGLDLGSVGWVIWGLVLLTAATNAVNITDGLDGLAAGSSALAYTAFIVVAFWAFRNFDVYQVPQALDLAVVASAMAGGTLGFLWWNAAPARIIMGDTGALALGAGLAGLALVTNTHLLLPILAGIFVLETLSVVIQVASFRFFHRRVFRMAPIHHHFELRAWPETTVIIRFWILQGLFVAVGLGVFYADFLSTGVLE